MKEELWRMVKLFLLWCLLFYVPIIGATVWGRISRNHEILYWTFALGCMLIDIVFFGKRYVKLSFGRIERRKIWPVVGMSVLIATAYVYVLHSVYKLIDIKHLFPIENIELSQLSSRIAYFFLYGCIFGPIAEEICFRGILLDGLLKMRCRPWIAILITALVFGLIHGYATNIISALLLGIIVGWLYWRTGSIIPCLIIHIVNNSFAFMPFLHFIHLSGQSNTVLLVIFVVSLLLLAYGLWWFGKKFTFADEFNK